MTTRCDGFADTTLSFFKKLAKNENKAWLVAPIAPNDTSAASESVLARWRASARTCVRFFVPMVLCACGARTDLRAGFHDATCTKPPWVLFHMKDGIAAIRADGSAFHVLPLVGDNPRAPAMSPDGAFLLYLTKTTVDVALQQSQESLMLRNLGTNDTRVIATNTATVAYPTMSRGAISPDNKWIAYGLTPSVRLVSVDGTGDHILVPGPETTTGHWWPYSYPQFSTDSERVFFSMIGTLEAIRTDGTGEQRMYRDESPTTTTSLPMKAVFPNVSVSPDGMKLVAQVMCAQSELRIFPLGSLPTSDPCATGTTLTKVDAYAIDDLGDLASTPSWGPGDAIAYADGGSFSIQRVLKVIPASGGAPVTLTADVAESADTPVWASGCADIP